MNIKINRIAIKLALALAVIFLLPNLAQASLTDGQIDGAYKYAWGENIGWVNFGATSGQVRVTDAGLSGYAWSANYGWINLNPPTAGVLNDGEGNLSGRAWGENLGWINFSGVTISSLGEFWGYATIENNQSRIVFNCDNTSSCSSSDFKVKTDWRPRRDRPGGAVIIVQPTGRSAASPPTAPAPEVKPPLEEIKPPVEAAEAAAEIPAAKPPPQAGKPALKPVSPLELALSKLKKIFAPLMSKLARLKPRLAPEIPLEKLVPKQAPLALSGQWQIMPAEPVNKFVFSPLPVELLKLAKKFPSLKRIFEEVNISKIADLGRLNKAALILPGLTETAGLPKSEVTSGKFSLLQGLPLADLTAAVKQNLPTEIVFAKAGGELIDYNIDLTIDEQGRPQQKITALANQEIKLVVKPEGQVSAVKGYLVFKSAEQAPVSRLKAGRLGWLAKPAYAEAENKPALAEEKTLASRPLLGRLQDYLSSLIFSRPSLAVKQSAPVPVEEKLVLAEFNYADSDGDGLWTAEIKTPAASGIYEIITVLYYKDPELGARAIKLTTVIDPEGYVYEKFQDKELRLPGAIITLYWFNSEAKKYQVWPSESYNQANPQLTDVSGKYSFLVPPGSYYLRIEAPGYPLYQGKPFQVKAGGGIHLNIELKAKYSWLRNLDWKTILLILVAIFLAYNFYKDKIRAKRSS